MSVFHVPSVCANANARGADALGRLCEHVDTFCTHPLVGEDFERVERELHERFVETEREVLGQLLESLDVDVPSVELGERRLHRVLKSTESYTTAVGPVKVARTLYRSARERAVVPMELRAGIVEGHWTPLAARQASRVVAQMTPSEGEALLRELGNMAPSKSSLDRLPKALSARWESSREAFESALREAAVVPEEAVTVAVSLDGVMVPMKDGKRAEKREHSRAAGRRAKGPAGYQEASCATLVPETRAAANYCFNQDLVVDEVAGRRVQEVGGVRDGQRSSHPHAEACKVRILSRNVRPDTKQFVVSVGPDVVVMTNTVEVAIDWNSGHV